MGSDRDGIDRQNSFRVQDISEQGPNVLNCLYSLNESFSL